MNFEISLSDRFVGQRWAALNEVSAAVAAAIGKGALGCQLRTPTFTGVPSTSSLSLGTWIKNIIVIALWGSQTTLRLPALISGTGRPH